MIHLKISLELFPLKVRHFLLSLFAELLFKTVDLHNKSVNNHIRARSFTLTSRTIISLDGITDVDELFYRHMFTCQEDEFAFDSESSDEHNGHSDLESSAGLDQRVEYQHDLQQTRQFIDNGCGCKLVKGMLLFWRILIFILCSKVLIKLDLFN